MLHHKIRWTYCFVNKGWKPWVFLAIQIILTLLAYCVVIYLWTALIEVTFSYILRWNIFVFGRGRNFWEIFLIGFFVILYELFFFRRSIYFIHVLMHFVEDNRKVLNKLRLLKTINWYLEITVIESNYLKSFFISLKYY
jgi:hypothetical protein